MQAVSLSSWTPMITSLLSALWSKQTQLEEQRVVTGAGTRGDLYLDLGTTSDHFGFPASLPAESKREWEKHECIDEHRIWPEYGGKQLSWARVGKTAQKGNENRRNMGRKEGLEKARQFLYKELHLRQDWWRLFTSVVEVVMGDIRLKIPSSGQCSKMA